MYESLEFAVYNGSPMRELSSFGKAGRFIYAGSVFKVTDDIRYRVLGWLNGTEEQKSYFSPTTEAYFKALPRCVAPGCNVAFTNEQAQLKHIAAHQYVAERAPELQELNRIKAEAWADKQLFHEMRARMTARRVARRVLKEGLDLSGYRAVIVDPAKGGRPKRAAMLPRAAEAGPSVPSGRKAGKSPTRLGDIKISA